MDTNLILIIFIVLKVGIILAINYKIFKPAAIYADVVSVCR